MSSKKKRVWIDTNTGKVHNWNQILFCVAENLGLQKNAGIPKIGAAAKRKVGASPTNRNAIAAFYDEIMGTALEKRRPKNPKPKPKSKPKPRSGKSALGFPHIKRQTTAGWIPRDEYDSFLTSRAWRELRYLALKNTEGRCECCGGSAKDGIQLHVDHIQPRSARPDLALALDNLQVLCDDCNVGKGAWDATDWRGLK